MTHSQVLFELPSETEMCKLINQHNKQADEGNHSFYLGVGPFADLTQKEYSYR